MSPSNLPRTVGELRAAGHRERGVKQEIRENLLTALADGEWVSTFSPGTPFAIAVAIQTLTACLPDGQWFPGQRVSRDFSTQSS